MCAVFPAMIGSILPKERDKYLVVATASFLLLLLLLLYCYCETNILLSRLPPTLSSTAPEATEESAGVPPSSTFIQGAKRDRGIRGRATCI